jgi:hypothetical protein
LSSTYVVIDCTWDRRISQAYPDLQKKGFRILSVNPTAQSSELKDVRFVCSWNSS